MHCLASPTNALVFSSFAGMKIEETVWSCFHLVILALSIAFPANAMG
jgi:hypothetical protein